jgi:ABC-type glycerol-3-phosphate transport system substrate-binding protein
MTTTNGTKSLSRRQTLRVMALGLAGAALAACGATPTATPAPVATKAPVPTATPTAKKAVTLKVLYEFSTDEANGIFAQSLALFGDRNADIKLDIQSVAQAKMPEVLQTRAAANDMAHVTFLVTARIAAYVINGMVQDIGTFVPQTIRDRYTPTSMIECTLNGGLYGLPMGYTAKGIIYNATYFKKAGITPPLKEADLWTWDQLVENAKLLQSKGGAKYGMQFANPSFDGWLPTLAQNGGSVGGETFDQPTLKQAPSVEALDWAVKLHKDGIAAPGVIEGTEDPTKLFTSGITAMWVNIHNGLQPAVQSQMTNFEWGVMLGPKKIKPATLAGGSSWIAFKGAEPHVEESARLILHLTSPEELAKVQSVSGQISALKDASTIVWKVRPDTMAIWMDEVRVGFDKLAQLATTNPVYAATRDRLLRELQMVVSGQKTPQQGGDSMSELFLTEAAAQKKK